MAVMQRQVKATCNPGATVATRPGRLQRQVQIVGKAAKLDQTRLLQWVLTQAGLSATWTLVDDVNPQMNMMIAQIAAAKPA